MSLILILFVAHPERTQLETLSLLIYLVLWIKIELWAVNGSSGSDAADPPRVSAHVCRE